MSTEIAQRTCPTCSSPQPKLHPAVQSEGEVQPCGDPWHVTETSIRPPLHHSVKLIIDSHGGVDGDITCTAPVGAPCRLTCPVKGAGACESWAETDCHHGALVDAGWCVAADWFENDGVVDCYAGPDAEVRSGPVEIEWHGGGYSWSYPTAASSNPAQIRALTTTPVEGEDGLY